VLQDGKNLVDSGVSSEEDKSREGENPQAGENPQGGESPQEGAAKSVAGDQSLVRLRKKVVFNGLEKNARVDGKVVSPRFYNTFNYQLLPREQLAGRLIFGIISPRIGDGKTLVASNLAISFAVANEKKTLLVDLNVGRPKLHRVFGTRLEPEFLAALQDQDIQVMDTPIKNLSLLPAGDASTSAGRLIPLVGDGNDASPTSGDVLLGVEHITEFRDLIYSLQQEFEVIIFDLPSLETAQVPALYLNLLNGVIVVVNSGTTKKEQIDSLLHHLKENQVVGFVFNRVPS
jgi:Mrp family chromosome partitioning ATPase